MGAIFSTTPAHFMTEANVLDLCEGDHIAVKHGLTTNHALFMGHEKGTVVTIDRYSKSIVETCMLNFLVESQTVFRVEYAQQVCVPPKMSTENASRMSRENPFGVESADSFRFVYHLKINCEGQRLTELPPVYGMAKRHNLDQSIPCSTSASAAPSVVEVFPLSNIFSQQPDLEESQTSVERRRFTDYRMHVDEVTPSPTPAPSPHPTAGARPSLKIDNEQLDKNYRPRPILEAGGRRSLMNDQVLTVRHIELSRDSTEDSILCLDRMKPIVLGRIPSQQENSSVSTSASSASSHTEFELVE